MPRVCASHAPLLVLIVAICAGPAYAAEQPRHLGLYIAKTGTRTAPPAELPAVSSAIEATARGPLIEVVTTQRFTNTSKHTIEAVYVFPLPPDAAVSAMAIRVGEKTIRAEIAPREQALSRHEAAVAAGVVGALFEQDRPDVFTQTITGITAGATVEIELRWDTIAARRDGLWELVVPLVVAARAVPGTATGRGVVGSGTSPDTDRSPDASRVTPPTRDDGSGTTTTFSLVLDERATDVTSPSHELVVKKSGDGMKVTTTDDTSARDLIVRWRAKGKPRGWLERDDAEGFVAVTVEASAKKGKAKPVRAVIAVDDDGAAGTEAALVGHRIERELVGALGAQDRYAVRDKDGAWPWHRAGGKVGELDSAAGLTSRHDLIALLGQIGRAAEAGDGAVEIVLVTDGLVADQGAVVEAAQALGRPIHVIGVGGAPNRSLIAAIAAATGGTARFADADEPAAIARAVAGDLAHPVAAPVIAWGGLEVTDVIPATLPRLGAGQAITVLARTAEPRAVKARVTGGRDGTFAIEVDQRPTAPLGATSPHGLVGRLWARAQLGELVATQAKPVDVSRLAMSYGLVSPYTAMIAVGEEVVDRAGTRRSVAVPVAIPSGMRWQAKFRDEQDARAAKAEAARRAAEVKAEEQREREARTSHRPVDRNVAQPGSTPQGGGTAGAAEPSTSPPPADVPRTGTVVRDAEDGDAGKGQGEALDTDADAKTDDDEDRGGGDFAEGTELSPQKESMSPGASDGEATYAMEVSGTVSRSGRRGLVLALRGSGGLAYGGETRGMGALSGRLGVALARRIELGADLSFWVIGTNPDYAFRTLVTTTVVGLAGGWIDLSLGVGLHIGDDSGLGYSAGLRFGRGRFGPTLRWDGAMLRGADAKFHSAGAVDLGLELDF